jgi:RNA polymerase sigma-70 factor (ECF subfamily)
MLKCEGWAKGSQNKLNQQWTGKAACSLGLFLKQPCISVASKTAQDDRSDDALISALNGGDASAFDAIYYRYRDWVVRLAFRFTSNHADSLDVLQETFAYLFGKFPGFILTARMTTFLYPVVKNLSIAARKKRERNVSDAALPDPAAPSSVDPGSARNELGIVLASLPETHRAVLLMRFVDDMSLAEIAAALGIPEGTVKSRVHNAIATLKKDPKAQRYFQA